MTLVFAYGSNMDDAQMNERCPSFEKVGIAELRGWRLHFPRHSKKRGCGVASIEPCDGEVVWGVVHRLNPADLVRLDASEGYRVGREPQMNGYNRVHVPVVMNGALVEVQTYIANRDDDVPPPNLRYLEQICDGARQQGLPDDYQTVLAALLDRHRP